MPKSSFVVAAICLHHTKMILTGTSGSPLNFRLHLPCGSLPLAKSQHNGSIDIFEINLMSQSFFVRS
jgi:hypothetical protein